MAARGRSKVGGVSHDAFCTLFTLFASISHESRHKSNQKHLLIGSPLSRLSLSSIDMQEISIYSVVGEFYALITIFLSLQNVSVTSLTIDYGLEVMIAIEKPDF